MYTHVMNLLLIGGILVVITIGIEMLIGPDRISKIVRTKIKEMDNKKLL